MAIYGHQLSYQFGRPITTKISWPSENSDSGSQINFVRTDGSEVITRENGLFSFFKLLDKATVRTIHSNKVEVTFTRETYKARYELSGNERIDPMVIAQLSHFICLSEL